MKKILLSGMLFLGLGANAQLADGSVAPDFTATDINGNSWTLSTILAAGKSVIMDISATWCGPCWSYHNTHALENLYQGYGPNGSDEVVVFYVEGDGSTTMADLNGTGPNTQGDWVTGTSYPILDNATIADNYEITYFPTVYMICPDGIIKEVGQLTTTQLIAEINADCGSTLVGAQNNASIEGSEIALCSTTGAPTATIHNYGTNTITTALLALKENGTQVATTTFSGSVASFGTGTATFASMTINPTSTYTVDLVSVNSGAPLNASVGNYDIVSATTTGYQITINCHTDNYPGEISWAIKNGAGTVVTQGGPYTPGTADEWGGGGADANTTKTTTVTLPTGDDCYSVELYDSFEDGWSLGSTAHGLEILCYGATILDLEVGNFGAELVRDAAMKTNAATSGIAELETANFNVYPNPATDKLTVSFDAINTDYTITLLDITGRTVVSNDYTNLSGSQAISVPVSGLTTGNYIVKISTNGVSYNQKVVIK